MNSILKYVFLWSMYVLCSLCAACLPCAIHNVRTASCRIGHHHGFSFFISLYPGTKLCSRFSQFSWQLEFHFHILLFLFANESSKSPIPLSLSLSIPVSRPHPLITEHFQASEMSDPSFSHLNVVRCMPAADSACAAPPGKAKPYH